MSMMQAFLQIPTLQEFETFSVSLITTRRLFHGVDANVAPPTVFYRCLAPLSFCRSCQFRSASLRPTRHRCTNSCRTQTPHATIEFTTSGPRGVCRFVVCSELRQSPAIFRVRIVQSGEKKGGHDHNVISGQTVYETRELPFVGEMIKFRVQKTLFRK